MTLTRRRFLGQVAATSAVVAAPAIARGRDANGTLQVAVVGSNGMGFADLQQVGSHPKAKFVGFCDIDANRFGPADKAHPGVRHFADYREMLDTLGAGLDAVIVSCPDHMHAPAAVAALKAGKHVYCQKPLTHTVWEARQMRLWADHAGVTTQMGNQIHSAAEYRLGTRLIKDGAIGKVKEVWSWIGVTGNERTRRLVPPPAAPVPANVNWDLWIGCAPMRDYAPVYHPFMWRDWQDFGGGGLGDFACHVLDPVFTALDLSEPLTVHARNSGINDQIWPTNEVVHYTFRGTRFTAGDTIKVTWMDGGLKPDRRLAQMPADHDLPGGGSLFVGEEGCMVLAHIAMPRLYPLEKFKDFTPPAVEARNHWHDWVDGCLAGEKTSDGFHYAGPLTEAVQLGNIATRLATPANDPASGQIVDAAKVLEWDMAALRFKNAPEADALITKPYRKGFEVPAAPVGKA